MDDLFYDLNWTDKARILGIPDAETEARWAEADEADWRKANPEAAARLDAEFAAAEVARKAAEAEAAAAAARLSRVPDGTWSDCPF